MTAGVAAGHPATAAAGIEILAEGGTAADAAVAMGLAACVAETVMTGLLGGGHAIWWDGRRAANLDCFVAVPRVLGAMSDLPMPFGDELVHYAVGPGSCGVPGLPAGLAALHEAGGRLPWARVVEPALRLARDGVPMPPQHARCLEMLAPAFTAGRGADLYASGGRLLGPGEVLRQPGLVETLRCLVDEGVESCYRGSVAEALLGVAGTTLTWDDLRDYAVRWLHPVVEEWHGFRVPTRAGLSRVPELLGHLPRLACRSSTDRVLALVTALEGATGPETHTTNLVAVDADRRACVLTTSLGLGAGAWTPGFDLHLNSMLGERDLVVGALLPGERMESMMAPTLAFDQDGLALAIGSAGGTRLRSALVTVLAAVLDERMPPEEAVARPRVHPAGTVHAEPGVDERALAQLEQQGRTVRRWDTLHHYFGGVSCVGRDGAAGDPRRDGAGVVLSQGG
jgi:gamma-glutamyltranspeptidase/glutathione hydrolase